MPDYLIDLIGILPPQIVYAYAMTKMLDIPRIRLYWILELALMLWACCFRADMGLVFRIAMGAVMGTFPAFMARGSIALKVIVVGLVQVVLLLEDIPTSALWIVMTGTPTADYDAVRTHFGAFLYVHLMHLALLIVLYMALYLLMRRFFGDARSKSDGGRYSMRLFAWFSLVQLGLVTTLLIVTLSTQGGTLPFLLVGIVLAIACLAAYVFLFFSLDAYERKRLDDQRALVLQDKINAYFASYGDVVAEVERTSRLRHDVRNQTQVIMALIARGQSDEAAEHARLMARELGEGSEEASQ